VELAPRLRGGMLGGVKALRIAPLVILALGAFAAAARAAMPACVRWSPLTVATGVGYNHVVEIENGCDKAAACVVSTDVAPDPIEATVPAREKIELVTFRGSPSYTFKAKVDCTLR
jgi:hypothetical protein